MKKIIVIGSGGAGKSTLARRLHEISGLPLVHIDQVFWKPNWTETPKAEMRAAIEKMVGGDEWIIDGNANSTMELRIAAADTVIFLDRPRLVCIFQVLKRVIKYRKKTRPDMGADCPEKFDWKFLVWVWNFPRREKPLIEDRLRHGGAGKNIIRLRSRRETEKFFENFAADRVKSK